MRNIALLPKEEREILFINTSRKMHITEAIVEKDFWVCFTLDYLFHESKWRDCLAFKGGTSLSKAYNLIERFSEDIDLILDWRVLGYKKNEPLEIPSNTKREHFIKDSKERLFYFLANDFTPIFCMDMNRILNEPVKIYVDPNDSGIVNFEYPSSFTDESILRIIRLEIGALAAWTPVNEINISPYINDYYPEVLEKGSTSILTTTAERTFWEKATILHQEAYRPDNSNIPVRYSRHYYDLYCMFKKGVLERAKDDGQLLEKVAEFKRLFYPRGWAHYELARIGTIKLFPAEHSISELRKDYEKMSKMIYGDYPSFDELLEQIVKIEHIINNS